MSCFGKTETEAKKRYRQFVERGIVMGKRPDLTGGGLLPSQGGWTEVVSMKRRRESEAGDDRILGGGTFVGAVLAELEQKKRGALRFRTSIPDLPSLATLIAEKKGSAFLIYSREQGKDPCHRHDVSSVRSH